MIKKITPTPPPPSSNSSEEGWEAWVAYCKQITPLPERHTQRIFQAPTPPPLPNKKIHTPAETSSLAHSLFHWNPSNHAPYALTPSEDEDRWSRHPVGRTQWKRWLQHYTPDDTIDLHGDTLDSAFHALSACLQQAQQLNFRTILCIHGKGLRNPQGEPVLRQALREWLIHCPSVIAYSAAPNHQGGNGATVIWLRFKP